MDQAINEEQKDLVYYHNAISACEARIRKAREKGLDALVAIQQAEIERLRKEGTEQGAGMMSDAE